MSCLMATFRDREDARRPAMGKSSGQDRLASQGDPETLPSFSASALEARSFVGGPCHVDGS